ncbi:MAG: flavin monoamine oxidase family protein [Chitinophagales bacterium]
MDTDIIIVGAGAAGLMAGRELAKKGYKIILLEARGHIGGRIYTFKENEFPVKAETGAEFIHGNLETTLNLLNEGGISYSIARGKMFRVKNGKIKKDNESMEYWREVERQLNDLKEDITVDAFIDKFFSGTQYLTISNSIKGFVEGFDSAETKFASTFAFKREWLGNGEEDQYRVEGGYSKLVQFLADEINKNAGTIFLSQVAKEINWSNNNVIITTNNNEKHKAKKVIITVPPPILLNEGAGQIRFVPPIDNKINAIQQLGFGEVIKILLYFKGPFWEEHQLKLRKMGFLFTEEQIPTWWTQHPEHSGLLTGWLAGPKAAAIKNEPDEKIMQLAILSLTNTFEFSESYIQDQLLDKKICNWSNDPFTMGAYAYETLTSKNARNILMEPVEATIYFAGDALYNGDSMGTVEAALVSGKNVAEKVEQG